MTVADLRCDLCGRALSGTAILEPGRAGSGVRLYLHPGDPLHRDDRTLVCTACWGGLRAEIGEPGRSNVCAVCGVGVAYRESLHLLEMTGRVGEAPLWQFCRAHGTDLLNRLITTDPKLAPGDLHLRADFPAG